MRLPVVPQLSTKNGTANQNARLTNVLKESAKTGEKAVIRPGLAAVLDYSGLGNGLIPFNNTLLSIYDDVIYADNAPPGSYGDFASPDVAFNLASIDWSAATTYSFGDGVWHDGVMWFSLVDSNTNNEPPALTSTVSTYWTPSFPPAWNSGYTYSAGAAVHYGGYYWFSSIAGNINNTPEVGDNWESPNPPASFTHTLTAEQRITGPETLYGFDTGLGSIDPTTFSGGTIDSLYSFVNGGDEETWFIVQGIFAQGAFTSITANSVTLNSADVFLYGDNGTVTYWAWLDGSMFTAETVYQVTIA